MSYMEEWARREIVRQDVRRAEDRRYIKSQAAKREAFEVKWGDTDGTHS